MEKEYLDFFKIPKKTDELFEKFGIETGAGILKKLVGEGFIEDSEDKKFYLTNAGKSKLEEIIRNEKRLKRRKLLKHPLITGLIIGLVLLILSNFITYKIAIGQTEKENALSLTLLGEPEITLKPLQEFQFNGIVIYNPTSKKVSLSGMFIGGEGDTEWIRWNRWKESTIISSNKSENQTYSLPQLQTDFKPYMEIESGSTKLMESLFYLTSPNETGTYKLNFYAKTMDGKIYHINRPLVVIVK